MKNRSYYLKILDELKQQSHQLNRLIESGVFHSLPFRQRYLLVRRIKRLYNRLRGPVSEIKLRYILAGAAVLVLGISCKPPRGDGPTNGNGTPAITFEEKTLSLVSSGNSVYWSAPAFADIDGDSVEDLFLGESGNSGHIQYYKNSGTAAAPSFDAPLEDNYAGPTLYMANLTFVNIDNDSDLDLFVVDGYGDIQYFKNSGTAGAPSFDAPQKNPDGLSNTAYYNNALVFVNIDSDADMDLFVGDADGNIQYFKNSGTAVAPSFDTPQQNPFGITKVYSVASPAFVDIDGDGDMDLLVGESYYYNLTKYGRIQFFENTGTASAPVFAAADPNPFSLPTTDSYAFLAIVDIDGDGDLDLFVGEYGGNIRYFENTTP